MVQDLMEIMEDPKPGLELSESLLKLSARTMLNFLEVCKKFSFGAGIRNEKI